MKVQRTWHMKLPFCKGVRPHWEMWAGKNKANFSLNGLLEARKDVYCATAGLLEELYWLFSTWTLDCVFGSMLQLRLNTHFFYWTYLNIFDNILILTCSLFCTVRFAHLQRWGVFEGPDFMIPSAAEIPVCNCNSSWYWSGDAVRGALRPEPCSYPGNYLIGYLVPSVNPTGSALILEGRGRQKLLGWSHWCAQGIPLTRTQRILLDI